MTAAHAHCHETALIGSPFRPALALSCLLLLAGCSSVPTNHGKVEGESFRGSELVQSDSNRMATIAMKENLDSLFALMDKLYRRNPGQWRATAESREAAVAYVRIAVLERQPWHELQGKRDVAALSLALQPDFAGDRIADLLRAGEPNTDRRLGRFLGIAGAGLQQEPGGSGPARLRSLEEIRALAQNGKPVRLDDECRRIASRSAGFSA